MEYLFSREILMKYNLFPYALAISTLYCVCHHGNFIIHISI